MFIRALGCLRLSLVLLCSLPTVRARVKIRESVSNSVRTRVDFYSSDREIEIRLCVAVALESHKGEPSLKPSRGERFFGDAAVTLCSSEVLLIAFYQP